MRRTAQHIFGNLNTDGIEVYRDYNSVTGEPEAIVVDANEEVALPWDDRYYDGVEYDENNGWVFKVDKQSIV